MSGLLLLLFPTLLAWFGFMSRHRTGTVEDAPLVTPSELAWAFGGPGRVVEAWQIVLEAEGFLERTSPYMSTALWEKRGLDQMPRNGFTTLGRCCLEGDMDVDDPSRRRGIYPGGAPGKPSLVMTRRRFRVSSAALSFLFA